MFEKIASFFGLYAGKIHRLFDKKKYYNPLYKPNYRNYLCPCKSGYKVKACHGQYKSVTRRQYEEIAAFWKLKK